MSVKGVVTTHIACNWKTGYDNFLESYYTGDNYVISAFTRFQPNDYHIVQRRLPEIRFDGLPVEAGSGIYHRVNASLCAKVL